MKGCKVRTLVLDASCSDDHFSFGSLISWTRFLHKHTYFLLSCFHPYFLPASQWRRREMAKSMTSKKIIRIVVVVYFFHFFCMHTRIMQRGIFLPLLVIVFWGEGWCLSHKSRSRQRKMFGLNLIYMSCNITPLCLVFVSRLTQSHSHADTEILEKILLLLPSSICISRPSLHSICFILILIYTLPSCSYSVPSSRVSGDDDLSS